MHFATVAGSLSPPLIEYPQIECTHFSLPLTETQTICGKASHLQTLHKEHLATAGYSLLSPRWLNTKV
jgi:hypothetical protein